MSDHTIAQLQENATPKSEQPEWDARWSAALGSVNDNPKERARLSKWRLALDRVRAYQAQLRAADQTRADSAQDNEEIIAKWAGSNHAPKPARPDDIAAFIAARCTVQPDVSAPFQQLYSAYVAWCDANTRPTGSKKALSKKIAALGFTSRVLEGRRIFHGIAERISE